MAIFPAGNGRMAIYTMYEGLKMRHGEGEAEHEFSECVWL